MSVEIGDSFRVGEVWESPRGFYYKVVERDGRLVKLRSGTDGTGRGRWREWDAVEGWVRPPEHNSGAEA